MKRLITVIAWCVTTLSLSAQDIMVTKTGDIKTVYGVEISPSSVFFKSSDATDAQIERIDKSEIHFIKRLDGTMYDLGNGDEASVSSNITAVQPEEADEYTISDEAVELNRQSIADINSRMPECTGEKEGDADRIFCAFGISEKSVLINDDIAIDISIGCVNWLVDKEGKYVSAYWPSNHAMSVKLKNRTAKTVYIDLGNTFFVRGDEASAYYVPTASTTSSTTGGGVGVNAGAVAGALGIGGAVGKLAGGVNVGGGKSSTSVSTTFSQRVIAIPPQSSKELDYKLLFEDYHGRGISIHNSSKYYPYNVIFRFGEDVGKKYCKRYKYQIGEKHFYNEENSPIRFSVFVTYSFSEDCTKTRSMQCELFAKGIVGYNVNNWKQEDDIKFNDSLGFSGKPAGKNYLFDYASAFPLP